MICFTVYGTPVPQGSTRAFIPKGWTRPVITAANAKTKPWRQEVAAAAMAVMDRDDYMASRPQAVRVECQFYFAKPKAAPKDALFKTTKPDLDKLSRSLLDALTGICFEDDSQVTQLWVNKCFSPQPRAEVRVTVIDKGAK